MKLFAFLVSLMSALASARAHPTLYEAIEINLQDPATVRVEFTIHAPELPTPMAGGIDPTAVDPAWLQGQSDEEIAILTREAVTFIKNTFELGWSSPDSTEPIPFLPQETLHFDSPEGIRHPPPDTKLPAGCLLASLTLANPGSPQSLVIRFDQSAQKRLLLAISRPAAFPEIHDLVPGESAAISLPEAPPRPATTPDRESPSVLKVVLALAGVVAVVAVGVFAGCRIWSKLD